MNQEFAGKNVSVQVGGGLGWYQGEIISVNTEQQTIKLTKVIHNGRPLCLNEVTINASDIIDLQLLSPEKDARCQQVPNSRVPSEVSEDRNGFAYPNSDEDTPSKQRTRTVGCTARGFSYVNRQLAHNGTSYSVWSSPQKGDKIGGNYAAATPKKERTRSARDMTTFGSPITDDILYTEFDFEKNLALFDKQAVIDEIQGMKPDVVRQVDQPRVRNYRRDENIVPLKPIPQKQITLPTDGSGELLYLTNAGIPVPSITCELHASLHSRANQHGLTYSRQLETIGRGVAETILSHIGGSRRLESGNLQEMPVVAILCGVHFQGSTGINVARQLQCQGVETCIAMPPLPSSPPLHFKYELQLYSLTRGKLCTPDCLPSTVDLIVDAIYDHTWSIGSSQTSSSWYNDVSSWTNVSKAPVMSIDPPSDLDCTHSYLPSRVVIASSLPLAYTAAKGKLYLVNLAIPVDVFSTLGIVYFPPFGAKFVIPLHLCE